MKISVVIPLYNKRDTILRALNSVFGQTFQPKEIMVVNDGSTDGSEQIVADLAHPLVKLISQPNQGVSNARNKGIQEANGKWIAFLDADDEWLPQFLQTIFYLNNEYPNALGYGTSYYKVFPNNLVKQCKLTRLQFTSPTGILNNYFEVCNYSDPPIWTSAVCVAKEELLKVEGFPKGIKAGEDLITWARLSRQGYFAYSTIPMAKYYQPLISLISLPPIEFDYVGDELKRIAETSNSEIERNEIEKYLENNR